MYLHQAINVVVQSKCSAAIAARELANSFTNGEAIMTDDPRTDSSLSTGQHHSTRCHTVSITVMDYGPGPTV
jgi:hypothetical protein